MPLYKIIGGDGKEYGPATVEQLRQWMAEGRVNLQTQVRLEGTSVWQPLGSLPEFASGAVSPPPPAVAPPSSPVPQPAAPVSVPSYLAQAILVTLCCCLPLGIPAIVFAAQVNGKLKAGDIAGAQESSRKAKMWCWIAFGIGLVLNLIVGIAQLLAVLATQRVGF